MWRSSLWSISWLRHHMFYPYVMISAAQARKSDDLRHAMSPFSLFLWRILGYVRPRRIVAVHPPKRGKRRSIWKSLRIGTAFALQMLLWRMQNLNWDTARIQGCQCGFSVMPSWLKLFSFPALLLGPSLSSVFLSYLCVPLRFSRSAEYLKCIQWTPGKFAAKVRQGRNMHFSWCRCVNIYCSLYVLFLKNVIPFFLSSSCPESPHPFPPERTVHLFWKVLFYSIFIRFGYKSWWPDALCDV